MKEIGFIGRACINLISTSVHVDGHVKHSHRIDLGDWLEQPQSRLVK